MRKKFKYCTYFYNIYSQPILRLIYKVEFPQEHKRKEKHKEKRNEDECSCPHPEHHMQILMCNTAAKSCLPEYTLSEESREKFNCDKI